MKIGPKYRIARRLGASVFDKTQTQKFALSTERRAKTKGRGRGPSEFGKQLLEKQKVRMTYGVSERQFANYIKEATTTHGKNPVDTLHAGLEMRLDNLVYRFGLAPTRGAARQMVSHGHVTVNGVKTTIPSRRIRVGEVIGVRAGSRESALFANFAEKTADRTLPSWLSWNVKEMTGSVASVPSAEAVDPAGDLVSVLSFYSR